MSEAKAKSESERVAKVLVWDLDETLWHGTLLEGDVVRPRAEALRVLEVLDRRGILHSIASRNHHEDAMAKLSELGLADYFLYPQIGWNAKSMGLRAIAEAINVGLDALAFVDDQPFERAEVQHALPEVLVLDAAELADVPDHPAFNPRFITNESAIRRQMYQADFARKQREESFEGPQEAFLESLGMRFCVELAEEDDLKRAEELTVRTNQLNATGYTYSYDELAALRASDDHILLVASLDDRYGTYGKIGLSLIEKRGAVWVLKLLLMSCRVMARGVGSILLSYLIQQARAAGVTLRAEFKATGRNRLMLVTYKFAGFREVERRGELTIFEHDFTTIQPYPAYVVLRLPNSVTASPPR